MANKDFQIEFVYPKFTCNVFGSFGVHRLETNARIVLLVADIVLAILQQ